MPEKGHTHNTRERRKQAEKNERKQEQRKKNINNYNMFIPQNKKQHIVHINKIYNGGNTINVKFKTGNIENIFIPGNCRLNKRKRQNVNNKEYLLIEESDLVIYTANSANYYLLRALNENEIKQLKNIENENEHWYWNEWSNEWSNELSNELDENKEEFDDDKTDINSNSEIDCPSDLDIDDI